MRVALYARVSTEKQEARGSIESQIEALRCHLAETEQTVVAEYRDDGCSGAILERPGLDQLRDHAEAGYLEAVWCLTPDRLARDFAHQALILDELARHGVEVRFLDSPPLDDPQARLLHQVQGIIAEYERSKIAERNRRGKLYRARAGEVPFGLVPYGYRRMGGGHEGPSRLEVYEPEAAVIRRLFEDFVHGGKSIRQLVLELHRDGVLSPGGRPMWTTSKLSKLLRNPAYRGRLLYNRTQAVSDRQRLGKHRRGFRPKEEWIEIPVPAIIDDDLFEAVTGAAATHSRFSPRRLREENWLLRRLVVCGACGVRTVCDRRGPNLYYYVCPHRDPVQAGGPDRRCRQPSVRAAELDAFVWGQIREALLRPELLWAGEKAVVNATGPSDDEVLAVQLARFERELARTAAEKARLFDGYQAGVLPLGELQRRVPEVDRRRLELQQQQAELEARRAELANHNRLRGRITTFAQRVRRGLEQLDFAGRQRLLRLLVEEVRVTGGRVQIRLRIPLDDPPPDPPDARNAEPPDPHKPGVSSVLPLRSRYSAVGRIAGRVSSS